MYAKTIESKWKSAIAAGCGAIAEHFPPAAGKALATTFEELPKPEENLIFRRVSAMKIPSAAR